MSKHTPGPWIVRHDFKCSNGATVIGIAAANLGPGAGAVAWPCGVTEVQEFANARLIAAAPDLLEALKDVRRHFYVNDCGDWALNSGVDEAKIDAAIAKAEGA